MYGYKLYLKRTLQLKPEIFSVKKNRRHPQLDDAEKFTRLPAQAGVQESKERTQKIRGFKVQGSQL